MRVFAYTFSSFMRREVDLARVVVIAGKEIPRSAHGDLGCRSPDIDVDKFPRFGGLDVF
jgi:hypothetical protein